MTIDDCTCDGDDGCEFHEHEPSVALAGRRKMIETRAELARLRQQISAMRGALARMSAHVLQLVTEKYNENSPPEEPKN